jgi:hypothetical protein
MLQRLVHNARLRSAGAGEDTSPSAAGAWTGLRLFLSRETAPDLAVRLRSAAVDAALAAAPRAVVPAWLLHLLQVRRRCRRAALASCFGPLFFRDSALSPSARDEFKASPSSAS